MRVARGGKTQAQNDEAHKQWRHEGTQRLVWAQAVEVIGVASSIHNVLGHDPAFGVAGDGASLTDYGDGRQAKGQSQNEDRQERWQEAL